MRVEKVATLGFALKKDQVNRPFRVNHGLRLDAAVGRLPHQHLLPDGSSQP